MKSQFWMVSLPLCSAILVAGSWLTFGGSLTPPAGPVVPTMKPLDEVEPRTAVNATNTPGDADSLYKITQPGSYYLTGNIAGVAGKHGIELVANGVTLDLMGFALEGTAGSLDGVSATIGVLYAKVRNGTILAWGDAGIDLTNGGHSDVNGITVSSCTGFGISVNTGSTVTGCRLVSNGAGGIATGANCVVTGCTAMANTGGGILAWDGCSVSNCTANANNVVGISARNGTTISGCAAFDNTAAGMTTGQTCVVTNCTAYSNGAAGISVGDHARVDACVAQANTGSGIVGVKHAIITGCTATKNTFDGILLTSHSIVRNNNCNFNGAVAGSGAGIHTTGVFNVIEANLCAENHRGVETFIGGNLIVKNTCGDNSVANYVLNGSNRYGPIVLFSGPSAPVNGDGPNASTLTSTDANANYSY